MTKTLLIVSGGGDAALAARHARALGHTVVVSDSDPQAPAFGFADSCLIADAHGASETAAAAERYSRKIRRIDGVLCLSDYVLAAATVTDRLRLRGLPLHIAELASDRLAIRKSFLSAGVPAPWHAEISTPQELQRVMIARGKELAIMPVENMGGHGRRLLASAEDPAAAFHAARESSPSQRVMVEQWPAAPRQELACWVADGVCQLDSDKAAQDMATRAASALGISEGPLTVQIAGQQVTGVAARVSGEVFLDKAIAAALG